MFGMLKYDRAAGLGPTQNASLAWRTCSDSRSGSENIATVYTLSSRQARLIRSASLPRFSSSESTATALIAGVNLARILRGLEPVLPPPTTMIGALYRYLREADSANFQPMNANFGLVDPLAAEVRDKHKKRELIAERALSDLSGWARDVAWVARAA